MQKRKPKIIIIAAMDANRLIGNASGLPWSIEEEYHHYLSLIKGQTVIMGRRSYEIFGEDLTSTSNLVVSRSLTEVPDGEVFEDFWLALDHGRGLTSDIFIAGGSSIYELALPVTDALYISHIKGTYQGNVYFPEFEFSNCRIAESSEHHQFTFVHYLKDSAP